MRWYYIGVNPDPWAIGPLQIGRRNGKFFPTIGANAQLVAFKEAVAEDLRSQDAEIMEYPAYRLMFFFWRRLDGVSRNKKHSADATNMQKATEDALQQVLIGNDRDVRDIHSIIIEQGPDVVRPGIIAGIGRFDDYINASAVVPANIWRLATSNEPHHPILNDNTWSGPG